MGTAFIVWVLVVVAVVAIMAATHNVLEGLGCIWLLILTLPVFLVVGAIMHADWGHCQPDGYNSVTSERC